MAERLLMVGFAARETLYVRRAQERAKLPGDISTRLARHAGPGQGPCPLPAQPGLLRGRSVRVLQPRQHAGPQRRVPRVGGADDITQAPGGQRLGQGEEAVQSAAFKEWAVCGFLEFFPRCFLFLSFFFQRHLLCIYSPHSSCLSVSRFVGLVFRCIEIHALRFCQRLLQYSIPLPLIARLDNLLFRQTCQLQEFSEGRKKKKKE